MTDGDIVAQVVDGNFAGKDRNGVDEEKIPVWPLVLLPAVEATQYHTHLFFRFTLYADAYHYACTLTKERHSPL